MKNHFITCLLATAVLAWCASVTAGPVAPGQLQLRNADGQTFAAQLKGDEWLSWVETTDGFVSVKNAKSGNYEYAKLQGGQLLPSGIKTGGAQGSAAKASAPGQLKASNASFHAFLKGRRHRAPEPRYMKPLRPPPSSAAGVTIMAATASGTT